METATAISISLLPTPLQLVSIPINVLHQYISKITRLILYRHGTSTRHQFLAITRNAVEVSVFCDETLIQKCFQHETLLAKSGYVAQPGEAEVGGDRWVALQVEQHSDDWDSAGARVKELAGPLAEHGISILFLATYASDYLLVKRKDVSSVFSRLASVGFDFKAEPDDLVLTRSTSHGHQGSHESSTPSYEVGGNEMPLSPISMGRSGPMYGSSPSPSPARSCGEGNITMAGAVILSRRSSSSSTSFGTSMVMSRSPTEGSIGVRTRGRPGALELVESPPSTAALDNDSEPLKSLASLAEESGLWPSVTILKDDVVCIGLDLSSESLWMVQVIKALFYAEDVLYRDVTPGSKPRKSADVDLASLSLNENVLPSPEEADKRRMGRQGSNFASVTLTNEEASLTADVHLLRRLFHPDAGGVFTTGRGGLWARWTGEEASDDECEDSDEDTEQEDRSNGKDSDDEGEEEDAEEEEEDEGESSDNDRTLRVCLQIDLSNEASFGLDRHGVIDAVSDRLLNENINMSYISTFKTANVLVPKSQLQKAQQSLQRRSLA